MILINGKAASVADLAEFVGALKRDDPGPWVCKCGRKHRGKDLSCWDVGGCGERRDEADQRLTEAAK